MLAQLDELTRAIVRRAMPAGEKAVLVEQRTSPLLHGGHGSSISSSELGMAVLTHPY
jgi:hypothetical protein